LPRSASECLGMPLSASDCRPHQECPSDRPLLIAPGASKGTHEHATRALWHLAAMDEIQAEIKEKGGLAPLIALLGDQNEILCQQYAAAAIEALARDHHENQIALAKAGAIGPLVALLGSVNVKTQEHAVYTLTSDDL
jgi:hypothetical protein